MEMFVSCFGTVRCRCDDGWQARGMPHVAQACSFRFLSRRKTVLPLGKSQAFYQATFSPQALASGIKRELAGRGGVDSGRVKNRDVQIVGFDHQGEFSAT